MMSIGNEEFLQEKETLDSPAKSKMAKVFKEFSPRSSDQRKSIMINDAPTEKKEVIKESEVASILIGSSRSSDKAAID
jgi:hypothetical protein